MPTEQEKIEAKANELVRLERTRLLDNLFVFLFALAGVAISMLISGAAGWFTSKNDPQITSLEQNVQDLKEQIHEKVLGDFEKKDSLSKTVVIEHFSNSAKDNAPTKSVEKKLVTTGQVIEGYLYVVASVDGKPLSRYDSVYIKLGSVIDNEYLELGGHLRRDKSLDAPKTETATRLLFDLSDVKYKASTPYAEDIEAASADWIRLLNGKNKKVIAFSSTTRTGTLEEVSIYYRCASGTECSVVAE